MPGRRFALVIRPDGRALLTTPEDLSDAERAVLVEAIASWEAGRLLIVERCDVVRVEDVEIFLPPAPGPTHVVLDPLTFAELERVR